MDQIVGQIVTALKSKGLYDQSLILFLSDNGGPLYISGSAKYVFPIHVHRSCPAHSRKQ